MTPAVPLAALAARWREEAELLRQHGALEAATTKLRDAEEIEAALAAWEDAPLTLAQAAKESGYSVGHLRRLLTSGALSDVSREGETRLRRGDLPRKPGRRPLDGPDLAGELLGLPSAGLATKRGA